VSDAAFERVRGRLAALIPDGALDDSREALGTFARGVYPVPQGNPVCVVRPCDAQQVVSVVRLAKEAGVNLVPVSSGPPHLKGGTVPADEGLVLDLSGMDGIIRLDRRNKVAIIEPGVTFEALRSRAREAGLRPLMPLLPRSTKSITGSYLEREPTTIPRHHWDMTDPLLCVEVVFGTGDVFRTGSAAGPGSLEDQWALGNAQKNPMGPAATDLLKLVQGAQGTMGIVTWASVSLALVPAVRHVNFVTGDDPEPLLRMARELCRKKLGDELLLLDSVNMSLMISCIHGDEADEGAGVKVTSAPSAVPGGRFTLVYAVAGYPGYLPEERVAYQERDIGEIAGGLGLRPAPEFGGITGEEMGRLLDGPCPGRHWKSRLEGACQDVFFLTTMDRAPEFIEVMDRTASDSGLDPGKIGTYLQPVQQGRSCHLEFNIFFDPDDEGARARAHSAAADASAAMAHRGAFFSRPYEPWVEEAYQRCGDTVSALHKLKEVFDPGDILNRGKLCFKGGVTDGAR
jgi:FAD/FMN-containing dehydrogenase